MPFVDKVVIFTFILKYIILSACFEPTTVPELAKDFSSNLSTAGSIEKRTFFFSFFKTAGTKEFSNPEAQMEPPECLKNLCTYVSKIHS